MAKHAKPVAPRAMRLASFVRFTDTQIIEAGEKPPLDDDEGNYAEPDVVLANGEEPENAPKTIDCGKHLIVYSSWSTRLKTSCDGYSGPKARNNDVVRKALANANAFAAKVKCNGDCIKRVAELWRGWTCSAVFDQFEPIGAVEIVIVCQEEF
jgi:hypothetical protein